jgi:hypothetical protein
MKKIFLFFAGMFFCSLLSAQQPANTEIKTEILTYKKEIPSADSYKVVKNNSGSSIPNAILEDINLYRRFDVDFLWVVNADIEILIYYVNKPQNNIETSK